MKPFPRLSGRLYLFPALLPLAEILPWLLTAIGAVAGAAGFAQRLTPKIRKAILLACVLLSIGLCAYFYRGALFPVEGTMPVPEKDFPAAVRGEGRPGSAVAPQSRFGEVWAVPVKKQILSTPVIAQGMLIFGSYQGSVEAHSLADGRNVWSLPAQAPVFALTQGGGDTIYAGEGLHEDVMANLTAVQIADGKVIWQRRFKGHIEEPLAISGKTLYTGAGPGGLWAVGAEDGDIAWHSDSGHADMTPLVIDGIVYAQAQPDEKTDRSFFSAFDAQDGEPLWRLELPGQPWGGPVHDAESGIILTTSGRGQIGVTRKSDAGWAHAISPDTRGIVWQKELPGMSIQPDILVPQRHMMIYALKTGQLVALDTRNGNEIWRVRVGAQLQAPAVMLEGEGEPLIAVTSFEGAFSILRARDGALLARYDVGKSATSSPVSIGDAIYVTTAHVLRAFSGVHALRGAP